MSASVVAGQPVSGAFLNPLNFLYKPGLAGGQTAFGGTVAADNLTLAANAAGNDGQIILDSEISISFDPTPTGLTHFLNVTPTYTGAAGLNGGFNYSPDITVTSAISIIEALRGLPIVRQQAATAFSAFTLFQALPLLTSASTAFNPMPPLVLNAGPTIEGTVAGNFPAVSTVTGVNFAAQTRATISGAIVNVTNIIGMQVQPTFSTVAGSTVNMGTITGLRCLAPTVALFQPQAGTENMTAYIGVDMLDITFGGASRVVNTIRSALTAATNVRFLNHTGNARSDLGGALAFTADLIGNIYGASDDFQDGWGAAGFYFWQFNATADQLRWSNVATNRYILETENGNADGELNMGFERFAFGQTGAVGNQVGVFVANARTIGVAGDWSDFLLTQAGSLTVGGLAMGRVSAWVINGISYASSSGSVTNADTLTVGGFPTSSPGVTITNRQSLFVIAGRSRFASAQSYDPRTPGALAAGTTQDYSGLLTGTANNGMRHFVRLEGDAGGTSALGGIDATAAQDGDCFKLCNVSANNVTLNHQDAGSAAANRFISPTGANYVLGPDESCEIIYDATTARWRIIYGTGA